MVYLHETKLRREGIDWDGFDFKAEVKLDRYLVEAQLAENPVLFSKYAEAYAEALLESDRASENVKVQGENLKDVVAVLDAKIRAEWQNLVDADGNKLFPKAPTETLIANWVLLQLEYKTAQNVLRKAREDQIEWNYAKERLYAGMKAFDNRMFSLGKLGDLLVKGIYSYPPRTLAGREMEERSCGEKTVDQAARIGETMKKPIRRVRKED